MGSPEANLWICETCEMIGSRDEAQRHRSETEHFVVMLDAPTSAAVREFQFRERAARAAAFVSFARRWRDASR